jgi:hypothetical protein
MKACNNKHGTAADPFEQKKSTKTERPMGIMCYICGREYFSKSISIHIENCKEKWIKEEALKPKAERRKMPEPPKKFDEMLLTGGKGNRDEYNDEAFKEYNEKALVPCEKCGRTFLPDSLKKHIKGCKGAKGGSGKSPERVSAKSPEKEEVKEEKKSPSSPKVIKEPIGLVCYICGGKFGSASLKIHIPQCEKKWIAEEAKKPKGE